MYKPKYFTLEELCQSETAEKLGINNFPTFEVAANLLALTEEILDPLRDAWGGPVNATSGYRSDLLNKEVGGSPSSVHPLGFAADLRPANGAIDGFIAFAVSWLKKNNIKFDQAIVETKGLTKWLHIGLYNKSGLQRRQTLNKQV